MRTSRVPPPCWMFQERSFMRRWWLIEYYSTVSDSVWKRHDDALKRITGHRNSRDGADEERPLLFAELERRKVRGRRHGIAVGADRDGKVDAGEGDARGLRCDRAQVVGEDESEGDHELHPLGGQQPQPGLAVRAFARLDVAYASAELRGRTLGADVA